ncbi:MAG: ribosome maturation factor RimM [Acidobacteriota bacterium]
MSNRGDLQSTGDDTIVVGRVIRPHGVRGEVVVEVLSDNPERFRPGSRLRIAFEDGRDDSLVIVERSRPHRDRLLVVFSAVGDRDQAEALRAGWLGVGRDEVAEDDGIVYHFQLLGCVCFDLNLGELGTVVDLIEDGGGLLLVVERGRQRLPVPFVQDFLQRLDVSAKRLDLELPEGLVELCAFES